MADSKITIARPTLALAGDTLAAASKLCDQLNLLFMMIERGNDEGDGGDVQLLAQIGRTLTSNGYNNFGMIADQIREGGANG